MRGEGESWGNGNFKGGGVTHNGGGIGLLIGDYDDYGVFQKT